MTRDEKISGYAAATIKGLQLQAQMFGVDLSCDELGEAYGIVLACRAHAEAALEEKKDRGSRARRAYEGLKAKCLKCLRSFKEQDEEREKTALELSSKLLESMGVKIK